jgi:dihydropyrimidine dehydrogenase (NAD+) subunit PreA
MQLYLISHGHLSVAGLVGRALPQIVSADDLDRSSICYPKFNRAKCVGCGRCALSCMDGGHQALRRSEKTGAPILDAEKCVGCHLCVAVCPVQAVSQGTRVKKEKSASEAAV